jgi:tetratricopeptide (TPR) repeat protein
MRLPAACLAFSLVLISASPPCAHALSGRSWEDCLKAPDRACVLDKAIDLVTLMDLMDRRRQALVAAIAETWAQAGDIDAATQLVTQISDRTLARAAALREIAAAQARTRQHAQAEATFDQALQLAYGWKDPLQRAEALHSIGQAQAAAGMKAGADAAFDQALQAAATVRILGEKGRVSLPAPETRLARLLQQLAMRQAEVGEMAQALQIARSIPYDLKMRARTLLALADLQTRAGLPAEATLDEALAAEHDGRGGMAKWPSWAELGIRGNDISGDVSLLCDIAKAQARAGLTAKAVASFDEALHAAEAIPRRDPTIGLTVGNQEEALALMRVADAQREAGLGAAARATLDRATTTEEAITVDGERPRTLALLAVVRAKAGDADAAQDLFAHALSTARARPEVRHRVLALKAVAIAQSDAGLRNDAASTFAEAVELARQQDELLREISDSERGVGLTPEAAATFAAALTAALSGDEQGKANRVIQVIRTIADNDRGHGVVAASPALRTRLLEATEVIADPLGQAEMLSVIARALPN